MTERVRMIILGLGALAVFGCWYNTLVAKMEARGTDRGYTAFLVVLGVATTVVVYALMVWNIQASILLLLCFVVSGTPMIVGSVKRHAAQRLALETERRQEAEEALRDQS